MTEANHSDQRQKYQAFWIKACEELMQLLFAYARKLANGREWDAKDLVQETTYRALAASQNPEKITKTPLAYLKGIMRHAWIDKWKRENTANVESLDNRPIKTAQPKQLKVDPAFAGAMETDEEKAQRQQMLGPLTPRENTLLKLYFKGNKCKEIADELREDVRITRSDLNAIRNKVRYRVNVRIKNSERNRSNNQ